MKWGCCCEDEGNIGPILINWIIRRKFVEMQLRTRNSFKILNAVLEFHLEKTHLSAVLKVCFYILRSVCSKPKRVWKFRCVLILRLLTCFPFSTFSTFVCPTEIIAFGDRIEEFRSINTEVVACSVDSQFTHLAWSVFCLKSGIKWVDLLLSHVQIALNMVIL